MTTVKVSLSQSPGDNFSPQDHNHYNNGSGEFLDIQKVMLSRTWSPCVWKDGYRTKVNFLEAQLIALDFDNGQWTLDHAVAYCKDYFLSYIIGTTKSHQKEKKTITGKISEACDRFRLVLLASEVCTDRRNYEFTMSELMKVMPCDKSCKDAARFFYPCTKIISAEFLGGVLPWEIAPPQTITREKIDKEAEHYRQKDSIPLWVKRAVKKGAAERHKTCYAIGAELSKIGYSEDEITEFVMDGPLSEIGAGDVRRAVRNGIEARYNGY